MSNRMTVLPEADRDLDGHSDYLAGTSPRTARRFLEAAAGAFRKLADMPGLGGAWETDNPHMAGLHVWPVHGFENFLIFYRPLPDGVEVVRVLHAARDIEGLFDKG